MHAEAPTARVLKIDYSSGSVRVDVMMNRRISLFNFLAVVTILCLVTGFAINEWKASKIRPTIVTSESQLKKLTSDSTSLLFIHDTYNKHYMIYDQTFSKFATTWTGRQHKCLILDSQLGLSRKEFDQLASKIVESARIDHEKFGIYSGIKTGFLIWYKNGKPIEHTYVLELLRGSRGSQRQELKKLSLETNKAFKNG